MLLLQAVGIRSAYIFAILSSVLLVGLIVDEVLRFCTGRKEKVGFWGTYILTMIPFAVIGVEAVTTVRLCFSISFKTETSGVRYLYSPCWQVRLDTALYG